MAQFYGFRSGSEFGQGFLFAQPEPVEIVDQWLAHQEVNQTIFYAGKNDISEFPEVLDAYSQPAS